MKTKVLIAQLGSRKHYQEPILLHQMGLLEALYTDFYAGNIFIQKALSTPYLNNRSPKFIKKALDRYSTELNDAKIIQFPHLYINRIGALKKLKKIVGHEIKDEKDDIYFRKKFCSEIIKHGYQESNCIYGFCGTSLELFLHAKEKGLRCVLDQTLVERDFGLNLLHEEVRIWKNWSIKNFKPPEINSEMSQRQRKEQDLADHIICGSDFVKDSLIERRLPSKKISTVSLGRTHSKPYPNIEKMRTPWKDRKEGLRILFAGSVSLRKGIPYLLKALEKLKDLPFKCKIAGSIQLNKEKLDQYSHVCEFLGRVPISSMSRLYSWADVMVLPSLFEGSAMVTYEALEYGIPIITTFNSGSIVSNGIGGWIVPIRDPDAIANALIELFNDGIEENFHAKLNSHLESTKVQGLNEFRKVFSFDENIYLSKKYLKDNPNSN